MLLSNGRLYEGLFILSRVWSVHFCFTSHLLSSLRGSFNKVTFWQVNWAFYSVRLVLKLLVKVNVEVTAEVTFVGRLVQFSYLIFLAHITLLLDVGFRVAVLYRLGPLSAENWLRFWILFASQRMIVICWQCVGKTLARLHMVDDHRSVSLSSR